MNYQAEVKQKWQETTSYKEYEEKTKSYSKDKWNDLAVEINNIFKEFSICLKNNLEPSSDETQKLVKALQNNIINNYYNCNNEILLSLGQMYVMDERFKNNIDKNRIGTSEYVSEAIKIYCKK